MPTATLVLVTYNSSDVLPACARAMHHLDVAGGYEIIVVDNASHDDSVAVARACWPQATIITNTDNRGFAAAVNQGVAAGSGRIVVTLNPDTEVQPHWLAALCDALDADDRIGVAGSVIYAPQHGVLTHSGADFDPITFRTTHTHESLTAISDMPYVTGAGMALRRRDWDALAGFDEGFFPAYFEDLDLCMRVRARGLRCVAVPAAQLQHHESTATGKQSGAFYYYYHRNRWRMIRQAHQQGAARHLLVEREAALLSQTNILDRSVALLVARMGLPTLHRGAPDAQTQATILATGQALRVLQGEAYADPAHWPPALQQLLGVDALQATATSYLAQHLSGAEQQQVLAELPPWQTDEPLYQQLFGTGWLATLRTRVLGAQFVHFVDAMRQRMVRHEARMQQQTTLLLTHVATAERLHIETIIRQALVLADFTER
jgi:GT2 family glycosyltransferase